jgi:hypothetical protein
VVKAFREYQTAEVSIWKVSRSWAGLGGGMEVLIGVPALPEHLGLLVEGEVLRRMDHLKFA